MGYPLCVARTPAKCQVYTHINNLCSIITLHIIFHAPAVAVSLHLDHQPFRLSEETYKNPRRLA